MGAFEEKIHKDAWEIKRKKARKMAPKRSWVQKLASDVKAHFKAKKAKKAGKKADTKRTSSVEKRLREAGVSDKRIKQLRGKK